VTLRLLVAGFLFLFFPVRKHPALTWLMQCCL